jgi:hypothetical protein
MMMAERTETDRRGIIPQTFTDLEGKKWTLELNFEVYRRVLANCDVDLCDIVYAEQKCLKQLSNPITLVDVLWEVCADQAVAAGIDEFGFARKLDMTVVDQAQRALLDEMLFFSRNHPRGRIVAEIVAAAKLKEKQMLDEVDRAFPAMQREIAEMMEKGKLFAPGEPDTSLPESSGFIPESGPSANSHGPRSESRSKDGTTPLASLPKRRKLTGTPRSAGASTSRTSSTRSRKAR